MMVRWGRFTGGLFLAVSMFCVQGWAAPAKPVTLKADVISYDSTTGISTAEGNVVIIQEDGEAKGESAEYNLKTRVGWIAGAVTATKGDASLAADRVWVQGENHITADGSAMVGKAGNRLFASQIDYWSDRQFAETSGGWARLTQEDGSVLTAEYINYDMKSGVAIAERNVNISSPPRNMTGAGDRAVYTAGTKEKPGDVVLSGNAWAIQDGNKIVGNTLIIKNDSSVSEAKGNVKMDIMPKDKPPVTDEKTKPEKSLDKEESQEIK